MTSRRPLVIINGKVQELPLDDTVVGITSEDDMGYAKQIDFYTEDIIYKGEAAPGSITSDAVWRIHKVVLSSDGDLSETWADGNTNFDNIWDNRLSLSYS